MRLAPLLVAFALLPLAGCSGSKPAAPADDRIVLTITDDARGNPVLSATNVTAAPNQLLEWRNAGEGTHMMSVDELAPYAHTLAFGPGGTASLRLGLAQGQTLTVWHLRCTYHPNLTMTVTVAAR